MIAERVSQCSLSFGEFNKVREKISLFGALSEQQLQKLLANVKTLSLGSGEVVFNQGQLPCNVYIVMHGEVEMTVDRGDGSTGKLVYKAGDSFGETAVIGIQPQLGEARVSKDAVLSVLSRSSLMDIASTDIEMFSILMMNIAREVSRRLHCVVTTGLGEEVYSMVRTH